MAENKGEAVKQGSINRLWEESSQDDMLKYVPEGFNTQYDFLEYVRRLYDEDYAHEKENIEAAEDDLRFAAGDQWDDDVRDYREGKSQPCLTVNTLPQFIGQIVGDRRVNKTAIKVLPREDSDTDVAQIRSDLIRNIEVQSRAQRVYLTAFEQEVTCGIGNFRIDLDYADDDVFDKDIFIREIHNPLAVLWDRMSVEPTGRDAQHVFVTDEIPRSEFEEQWPDHQPSRLGTNLADATYGEGNWYDKNTVRIAEFWQMVERDREIALMQDGSVRDITDEEDPTQIEGIYRDGNSRIRTRKVKRRYAQMHLITGFSVLEGPYEMNINRLPIIRCNGREIWAENKRHRFGIVRFAKDPQRLKNYWRSVAAEVLSKAPRAQWFGPADAFEGREEQWRDAHLTGDPILPYNSDATTPPQQMPPIQIPQAILNEAHLNTQDMKDVTGLQDASFGAQSNERSGKAIMQRQQEGDIATTHYHDTMNWAQQEAGDIINQLIPIVYDTARTVRIVGTDETSKLVRINDSMDENAIDITRGRYDVTFATGPAYMTRRQEAAESMIEMAGQAPQMFQVAGDLIAKAQDWPMAEEVAARLYKTIPPEVRNADPDKMDEEGDQQQQQAAAAQAQAQQMEMAKVQAETQKAQAEAIEAQAQAREARARAAQAEAEAQKAGVQLQEEEVELGRNIAKTFDELNPQQESQTATSGAE